MSTPSRRQFLGAGLISLSGLPLLADDKQPKPNDTQPPKTDKPVEKTTAPTQPPPVTVKAEEPKKNSDGDQAPFQPNMLMLTWQRDPTTTMTIQWVGTRGETSDTKIYYRLPSDKREQSIETQMLPYPQTDFKVFRAELTNLQPGSEYSFKIGRYSPTYKFRTMPAKLTNTFSFISGGDCGCNPHAINHNIIAAKQDPAFTLIGGDLGYDDGRKVEISLAFLRNYSQHMVTRDGYLIPLVACIGNHEVNGGYLPNDPNAREKAPFFYALFDGLFPETGYNTLDFGDYLSLVLLDTGHTSAIGGEQADWLESVLRERRDHPHVICAGHVPSYPSARSMGTSDMPGTGAESREHWVPLFDRYRVPVVLEHHDHTFKRTKPLIDGTADDNGVVYLGDGSWGRLRPLQPPEKLPHMARMSKEYHLSLHRLEGEDRFHMALDEFGKVMDVTRTGQRTDS